MGEGAAVRAGSGPSGQAAGIGGRAGAMGTLGLCPKSCKRFGLKNARGGNLKQRMGSGQRMGRSGQRMHFVAKNDFSWAKKYVSS